MREVKFQSTISTELRVDASVLRQGNFDIEKDLKRKVRDELFIELGRFTIEGYKYETELNISVRNSINHMQKVIVGELEIYLVVPEGGVANA